MIFGIGTDIVTVARIEAAILRHGVAFAERILSAQELVEFKTHAHPSRFLSKRFAAKEALAKATGLGLRHPVSLRRISIVHNELGKPALHFDEVLSEYLQQLGVASHHLSISDEREMVVAFVVLEGR